MVHRWDSVTCSRVISVRVENVNIGATRYSANVDFTMVRYVYSKGLSFSSFQEVSPGL